MLGVRVDQGGGRGQPHHYPHPYTGHPLLYPYASSASTEVFQVHVLVSIRRGVYMYMYMYVHINFTQYMYIIIHVRKCYNTYNCKYT